jgi:hypothetical protein
MEHENGFDIEKFLLSATPNGCADMLAAMVHDLKNNLQPNALHIKLGALSREMDTDQYLELRMEQLLKDMSLVKSKLHQLLGIRE